MSKADWKTAIEFEDITYKKCNNVARIAFNRPNVRNAFRPKTTSELYKALVVVIKKLEDIKVMWVKMDTIA